MNYFLQKKWYRDLFSKRTFFKSSKGEWKDLKNFKIGEKIIEIDGKWNSQVFCDCGNELSHSQSFVESKDMGVGLTVYTYLCSHCNKVSHFNPDVIPGLFPCDDKGNPITKTL